MGDLVREKTGDAAIAVGDCPTWLQEHAAEEFARYAEQVTGRRPARVAASEARQWRGPVIVIGSSAVNPLTRSLDRRGRLAVDWDGLGRDGFIAQSAQEGDRRYLVLAGGTDLATLYAVYDYLERFVGVGFFPDGDYVPRRGNLPLDGIGVLEKPRFVDRFWNSDMGHWSLKKYQSRFWTWEEWKRQIDWMVKRKLNMTNYLMMSDSFLSVRREIFGLPALEAKAEYSADPSNWAYPVGWAYPEGYGEELAENVFAYARSFGIRIIYWIDFGRVFPEFRTQHPELRYLADDYGSWFLSPDDPRAMEVTQGYLRCIIERFGTDHLYCWTPYCEAKVGALPGEDIALKTTAARKLLTALQKVDPEAIWVSDTWDFKCYHETTWTRENVIRYLDGLPKEKMYLYETGIDVLPEGFYARNDYYRGIPWAIGVLHSYVANEEWHGDMAGLVEEVKQVAQEPAASGCQGFFLVPELTNANIPYWHLVTKLAWNPIQVEMDRFLEEYVHTRYGEVSFERMLAAWKIVRETVYSGPRFEPPRLDTFNQIYYQQAPRFLPFTDRPGIRASAAHWAEKAQRLGEALALALGEQDRQRENSLYENDIVDLARMVFGLRFNQHAIEAYEAFAVGDIDAFEQRAGAALGNMDATAAILSNRTDFSLCRMIEEVLSVPGVNPYSAEMIRQACVAGGDYNANDVYELIVLFYRPRIEQYFSLLRGKLGRKETTVMQAEFDDAPLKEAWRGHSLKIPQEAPFRGNALEAVTEFCDQ
ncbi:MAG: alpha-N-acetylglucosaminidase TIM-barrel domain-containing protein [Candidatus Latescibacterota bacterium]